jgi:acyl-CoA thioester hydrolase
VQGEVLSVTFNILILFALILEVYNLNMAVFNFFYPIEVRYGDLDPQGHLNNAKYLTYFEHARISYIAHLGLWQSDSFKDIGVILADAKVTYLSPIIFGQKVKVGVRTAKLGNKSMSMEYLLQDTTSGDELASGSTILVAYDYRKQSTMPIPAHWRQVISVFEDLPDTV